MDFFDKLAKAVDQVEKSGAIDSTSQPVQIISYSKPSNSLKDLPMHLSI
ncbi:MAG: hypothetical protein HUJ53_09960 [Holdemanella sp.]|nr:hypothetical protein [Holdemanella sp.]